MQIKTKRERDSFLALTRIDISSLFGGRARQRSVGVVWSGTMTRWAEMGLGWDSSFFSFLII